MLSERTGLILKSIINWYIERATPVSSQNLVNDFSLGVSSATVRNEMAFLEDEGYITRPHTSSGSVPSDKGYRFYVASLDQSALPLSEQRMISHLFHQVESSLDEWLGLGAAVLSRLSQNTAVVTVPKPSGCHFRHLELVSLRDTAALLVVVLRGAQIKQRLLTFDKVVSQEELRALADKLNPVYLGLSNAGVETKALKRFPLEQQVTAELIKIMQAEDTREYDQSYLEGLHFLLNQPEFAHNRRVFSILELLEHRAMLGSILPQEAAGKDVRVVIGSENKAEVAQDCSLVIAHYGIREASGTIVVVGPTRMAYPRVIASVSHFSTLLSGLIAELYGLNNFTQPHPDNLN